MALNDLFVKNIHAGTRCKTYSRARILTHVREMPDCGNEPRPAIYPLLAMANATGGSDGRRGYMRFDQLDRRLARSLL